MPRSVKNNSDPTYFLPPEDAKRMAYEASITTPQAKKVQEASGPVLRKRHNEDDFPEIPVKTRRTVILTPNVTPSTVAATDVTFNSDSIIQHAYMRIMIFYTFAVALYQTGMRTDEDKPSEMQHAIGGSRTQVGRSKRSGYDAAHHNAASGVFDNYKQVLVKQALEDVTLTARKRTFLREKGVTEPQIEALQAAVENDPENFPKLVNAFWPHSLPRSSVLEDTILNVIGNSTAGMPELLNRKVDRGLETSQRPLIAFLYDQVAAGEMTPEAACEIFCEEVKKHFDLSEQILKEKNNHLKSYKTILHQLFSGVIDQSINYDRVLNDVAELDAERISIQHDHGPGTPKVNLPINTEFLKICRRIVHTPNEWNPLGKIAEVLTSVFRDLKDEVNHKLHQTHEYLIFAGLERQGSEIPPFEMLIKPTERARIRKMINQTQNDLEPPSTPLRPNFHTPSRNLSAGTGAPKSLVDDTSLKPSPKRTPLRPTRIDFDSV
jgi:hypothetical protein